METSFPKIKTVEISTTSPTKINIFTPSIPESVTQIADLVMLSTGLPLNALVAFIILINSPLRKTSFNCYIVSLSCSNFVILFEPLQKVLRWLLQLNIKMNMDYVFLISFDVPIIILVVMSIEEYVTVCQKNSELHKFLLKPKTAMNATFLIWIVCIMAIAIQLHIYDFFEGFVHDIYIWCSALFTILPLIVFLLLNSFVLYELIILKAIEGCWRERELKDFIMLTSIMTAFVFTMVPYRLARAINFMAPKASCCIDSRREVLYLLLKTFPTLVPIIYICASTKFRDTVQNILRLKRHKTEEVATS